MKTDFFFRHKKQMTRSFLSFRLLARGPVSFVGDVTVVDPFRVFFRQSAENMNTLLGAIEHSRDFVLTYRGYETVFVVSTEDNLFRLVRNGIGVGEIVDLEADPPEHGHCDNKNLFVAVIPDILLYMLDQENRRKVNILTQLTARETNGYKISLNILDSVVSLPGSLPIDEKLSEDEDEADTDANIVKPSKKKESYKRMSIRGVNGWLFSSGELEGADIIINKSKRFPDVGPWKESRKTFLETNSAIDAIIETGGMWTLMTDSSSSDSDSMTDSSSSDSDSMTDSSSSDSDSSDDGLE